MIFIAKWQNFYMEKRLMPKQTSPNNKVVFSVLKNILFSQYTYIISHLSYTLNHIDLVQHCLNNNE